MASPNILATHIQQNSTQEETEANEATDQQDNSSNRVGDVDITSGGGGTFTLNATGADGTYYNARLNLTGTPAGVVEVRMPNTNDRSNLSFNNESGQTVTLENSTGTAANPVTIADGDSTTISYDGTDFIETGGGGGGASTFLGLSDTPGSYAGEAGKVAAVNGGETALEFITVSGGGATTVFEDWEELAVVEGTNVASIDSTFWAAGTYTEIEVSVVDLEVLTDTADLYLRVSTDGATFDSGASDYRFNLQGFQSNGGAQFEIEGNGTTFLQLTENQGNAAGEIANGRYRFLSADDTGTESHMVGQTSYIAATAAYVSVVNGGFRDANGAIRGIQVLASTGNVTGKIVVRGRRENPALIDSIPLSLGSARYIDSNDIPDANSTGAGDSSGGLLAVDTTPSYGRVNGATDKALRVNWVAGNTDELQFEPTFMPPNLDEAQDLTIHLLARMSGATDTPTIDVQVFDGIGDTEMGGATAALSNTLAELTVTISSADISGHPLGFLNISLIPGAHATDALELFAAWIEYQRKTI